MFSMTPVEGPYGDDQYYGCGPVAFNDAGQIAFSCGGGGTVWVSVVGGGWVRVPIPPLKAVFGEEARALSADGTVVVFYRQKHGVRGSYTWHPERGMVMLEVPPGTKWGEAYVINDAGVVAGSIRTRRRAAVWQPDGSLAPQQPRPLSEPAGTQAIAINNSGELLISTWNNRTFFDKVPVRWSPEHGARPLIMQDGRAAYCGLDINDSGQVLGCFCDSDKCAVFVSDRQGRYMLLDAPYEAYSKPIGNINNAGQVVWHEYSFTERRIKYRDADSGPHLLLDLVDPSSPWPALVAMAVQAHLNNRGQILVFALMTDGKRGMFLLEPMAP